MGGVGENSSGDLFLCFSTGNRGLPAGGGLSALATQLLPAGYDWRMLFVVMLPIGLGALWFGVSRMVNVTTPRYAPLDVLSEMRRPGHRFGTCSGTWQNSFAHR